eukprot:160998-Prymnesium_polylepis.2
MKKRKNPANSRRKRRRAVLMTRIDNRCKRTFRRVESIAPADVRGNLASFDRQHAHVQEDEAQMQQRGQRTCCSTSPCSRSPSCPLPHWLEAKVKPEEAGADKKSNNNTGLFGVPWDQKNPPRQHQLAAHLERLPPEGCSLVVAR